MASDGVEQERRMGEWGSHSDWRAICHLAEREKIQLSLKCSIPALTVMAAISVTLLREVIAGQQRISLLRPKRSLGKLIRGRTAVNDLAH